MLILTVGPVWAQIDEKETAQAFLENALNKRRDIMVGAGSSYYHIKGDGVTNSSGIEALNYHYYIGASGIQYLENFPQWYTVLMFSAGKQHLKMPGNPLGDELTIYNAESLEAWHLKAEVMFFGYALIKRKAFFVGLETGPTVELLGEEVIKGHGQTRKNYLSGDEYKGFYWGWAAGCTAGFRSLFVNLSMGTGLTDYAKADDKSVTIPFHTKLSVGIRLNSSAYGDQDAGLLDKLSF